MSRVLSELLGAEEPAFSYAVQDLELQSGSTGIDIRLQIELTAKTQAKLRELGLDPRDTTAKEFYHGLQGITALHDSFLIKYLGSDDKTKPSDHLPKVAELAKRLHPDTQCWVLKHSVLKRLLKAQPPKQTMKHLGYKSVDSMLKRENTALILLASRCVETEHWQQQYTLQLNKLTPSDFEKRDIAIMLPSGTKWQRITESYLAKQHSVVVHAKEVGAIAILPIERSDIRGLTITVLPLVIHYMNEIRLYSAYFKLSQVRPDFAEVVTTSLLYDRPTSIRLAGQPLHWRVIQRHFGRSGRTLHPEIFEPHIQAEDIRWHQAEALLYKTEPALKFWDGLEYAALPTKTGPLSLNLLDNAINYFNKLDYEERTYGHGRANLWHELLSRYLRSESLEQQVIDQLNQDLLSVESTILFAEELL